MSRNRWDEPAPPPTQSSQSPAGPPQAQLDAAERAAAIAAKLTSQIRPPPSEPAPPPPPPKREGTIFDGEFTHDIEINDLRNRYLLTKGSTQQALHAETGASITTKGVWLPDKSKATAAEPPLYLHIAAMTKEALDIAVAKVNDLIAQELGPLVEDRSQWARNRAQFSAGGAPLTGANASPAGPPGGGAGSPTRPSEGSPHGGPPGGGFGGMRGGFGGGMRGGFGGGDRGGFGGGGPERRKWPEEKVFIGLESLRNFNVRAKVVGPGGMFVKHIQSETGTRVQIKGQGSGFYEQDTGREGDDLMHISISGPEESMIERAKLLADDLLLVVRSEWTKARDANAQGQAQQGYGGLGQGGYQQQQQQSATAQAYYQAAYAQQAPPQPGGEAPPPPPADGQAPPAPPADGSAVPATTPGGTAVPAEDPQEAYRKYW
ncbi:hypothetical protein BDY24DRAFT_286901 [Mrakia frigida]|uniref:KH domain-containing protein n=1 Tax=Mrakia frigida TaxID=29902 RepID=UPI003FCC018A